MSAVLPFVAANAETIIALCALVVSVASILVAYFTYRAQITHNRLSVRPIGRIELSTGPDFVRVYLHNVGVGPLLCDQLRIYRSPDEVRPSFEGLVPLSPEHRQLVSTLIVKRTDFAIPAGEQLTIYEVRSKTHDSAAWQEIRQLIRDSLGQITLEFAYRDIYDQPIAIKTRTSW